MPKTRWERNRYGKQVVAVLIGIVLCGVIAWGQKGEDTEAKEGTTLEDLGVTAAQKASLETLWDLKRKKDIQAIDDLKTLNRLAKDTLAADAEIQETLDAFRAKRQEMQKQIGDLEAELVQALPTRAQLHLTLMGVLENGVPRRPKRSQTETSKPESGASEK